MRFAFWKKQTREVKIKDETQVINVWKPRPLKAKVLCVHRGEFVLTDCKEVDAEHIQFKDPFSRKQQKKRIAVSPSVASGFTPLKTMEKILRVPEKRYRCHFWIFGEASTRDPFYGGVNVDPKLLYDEMLQHNHINEEGIMTLQDGSKKQIFMVEGDLISIKDWTKFDQSAQVYLQSQTAQDMEEEAMKFLGEGLVKDPDRVKRWVDIIVPCFALFIFAVCMYMVLKGAGYDL